MAEMKGNEGRAAIHHYLRRITERVKHRL